MEERVQRIQTTTLQGQVYAELKEALLEGRFVPGESLTTRGLAESLGTSEMPVREALQRLIAERALVQQPNRSVSVPTMTRSSFDELMIIRIVVEGLAASLAAAQVSESEITTIARLNDEYVAAIARQQAADVLSHNHRFHTAIYESAQAPILMEIINSLWLRFGPFLAQAFEGAADPFAMFERAGQSHTAAVDALRARDGKGARAAVEEDLSRFAAWYRESPGY